MVLNNSSVSKPKSNKTKEKINCSCTTKRQILIFTLEKKKRQLACRRITYIVWLGFGPFRAIITNDKVLLI